MEKHEKVYQELKRRIKADLIDSGELCPGASLPTRVELIKRFGGSTRSMMKAVQLLEREGLIVRLSPKKFALTVHPSTPKALKPTCTWKVTTNTAAGSTVRCS